MGLYKIAAILGYSILFAAIIGVVRFKQTPKAYRPFFYLVWLGLVNHTASLVFVHYFHSNSINGNIFVLLESLLFLYLFKNWGLFKSKPITFLLLSFSLITVWIVDNLILHSLLSANAGFRIINAFLLVFLAIEQMTHLITNARKKPLFDPVFIICTGILIYFSYKAFIEVFFLMETNASLSLITNIYAILVYINCFVNLLYGWAALWIPRKNQSLF
jgi:hypothetical protein